MKKINSNKAPQPIGPYSQAIISNNFLFISGQIPINPETNKIESESIEQQTQQVFNNVKEILKEAKLTTDNLVRVEIYLKNIEDFKKVNEIYEKQFTKNYPARHVVEVSNLPLNSKIEITCIAELESS